MTDEDTRRARLIDELGQTEERIAPFKRDFARVEDLRKLVRSWCDQEPAEEPCSIAGVAFEAALGPCGLKRVLLSKVKLIKAIGAAKFRDVASVTFDTIDALLRPLEQIGIVAKKPVGTRTLEVRRRAVAHDIATTGKAA